MTTLVIATNLPVLLLFIITSITFILSCIYDFNKNKKNEKEDIENSHDEFIKPISNGILSFTLENLTNREIALDICNLKQDDSYKFHVSSDYEKLVEYLKLNHLNVCSTRVFYSNDSWKKDIVTSRSFNPFRVSEKPIIRGFNNFNNTQFQRNIIESDELYLFNYFNTLIVKLTPFDKKTINLITTSDDSDFYTERLKKDISCNPIKEFLSLSIKNNTDEEKIVNLFDKEYYKALNNNIEIKSIYNDDFFIPYFEEPIKVEKIKICTDLEKAECVINGEEYLIVSEKKCFFNKDIIELVMKNAIMIDKFCLKIHPNSELLISFY
jgi:hypothetical protein